jgi:hypothetical protein
VDASECSIRVAVSGLVFGSVRMSLLLQKALNEGYARNLLTWQVSVFCRMVRFVNS